MTKEVALELNSLSYSYVSSWTNKQQAVIRDITLQVASGEAFGFLGQNGAGKTTTIKCILDLVKPRSGDVKILGISAKIPSSRNAVGYLPEQPYWYDHLTVDATMTFYSDLYQIPRDKQPSVITDTLEKVGLTSRRKSIVRSLSKGLTQRLGLAITIVHSPKLLLLDEPFSGLDPVGRKEFKDIFFEQKTKGVTIFMSSHILDDVAQICDRASILKDGSLAKIIDLKHKDSDAAQVNFYEVRYMRNQEQITKQFSNYDDAMTEMKNLMNAHHQIISFTPSLKSLEQMFIETVKS